jgi:hypothetical protein
VNLPKDKAIYIGQYGFRYCFELSTITIGGDCGFYNDEVIPNNFITYYKSNIDHDAKAAGVYTYKGSSWSYEELPSE